MSKIIVKPAKVKAFLMSPDGVEIQAFRPTVVAKSSFISVMISQGKIKLASDVELSNETTDATFKAIYFSDEIVKASEGDDSKREILSIEQLVKDYSYSAAKKRADEAALAAAEAASAAEKAAKEAAVADKAAAEKAAAKSAK